MRVWLIVVATVALGVMIHSFADTCNDPCRHDDDLEGLRCGLPDCVYVSYEESERFAGRTCNDTQPHCRNHNPRAGRCNHLVDVFCKVKKYKCVRGDGSICSRAQPEREIGVARQQPTGLDCQGLRCRPPVPHPAPRPTP